MTRMPLNTSRSRSALAADDPSRARAGHVVFAVTMIALGILGLISRDFVVVWQPVPQGVPAREVLVYVCALVSLISGIALFNERTAAPAARVLLAYLLAWLL